MKHYVEIYDLPELADWNDNPDKCCTRRIQIDTNEGVESLLNYLCVGQYYQIRCYQLDTCYMVNLREVRPILKVNGVDYAGVRINGDIYEVTRYNTGAKCMPLDREWPVLSISNDFDYAIQEWSESGFNHQLKRFNGFADMQAELRRKYEESMRDLENQWNSETWHSNKTSDMVGMGMQWFCHAGKYEIYLSEKEKAKEPVFYVIGDIIDFTPGCESYMMWPICIRRPEQYLFNAAVRQEGITQGMAEAIYDTLCANNDLAFDRFTCNYERIIAFWNVLNDGQEGTPHDQDGKVAIPDFRELAERYPA